MRSVFANQRMVRVLPARLGYYSQSLVSLYATVHHHVVPAASPPPGAPQDTFAGEACPLQSALFRDVLDVGARFNTTNRQCREEIVGQETLRFGAETLPAKLWRDRDADVIAGRVGCGPDTMIGHKANRRVFPVDDQKRAALIANRWLARVEMLKLGERHRINSGRPARDRRVILPAMEQRNVGGLHRSQIDAAPIEEQLG